MGKHELKPFKIGYGDRVYKIHPVLASVQDEEAYTARFALISEKDEERFQKEFDLCLEGIAAFSGKVEKAGRDDKGEIFYTPLEGDTLLSALKAELGERTTENERIVRRGYTIIKNLWDPSVAF